MYLLSNDWHISNKNNDQIIYAIDEKIKFAKQNNISTFFILGDLFQSREAQTIPNFTILEEILKKTYENNIHVVLMSGNHDKTDYKSQDSFLNTYIHYPEVTLIKDYTLIQENGVNFHLLPFFDESILIEKINAIQAQKRGKNLLLSHFGLTGSVNNDGSKVENGITVDLLSKFDKVFLGHYHNYHKVNEKIIHLPSLRQKDFGENDLKGFTLLNADLSYEIQKVNYLNYKVININLDTISKKELNEILKNKPDEKNKIRLKVTGNEDNLSILNVNELKNLGFDIKKENKEIKVTINQAIENNIVQFTNSLLIDEFKELCEIEQYDNMETGLQFLTKKLQQNERKS